MNYDIQLGKYKVAHLLSCQVRKSANKLSDTATVKLSGMAYSKALDVEKKIKRGDQVNIKLGYNDTLQQEFKGYIRSISTDNTISVECEDAMFLMRKEVKNKQYKEIQASAVIEETVQQVGGFTVEKGEGVSKVKYDKFIVSNNTAFDVLKKIKRETGLLIFVKGKKLHIHLKDKHKTGEVNYDFTKNVEKSSLKYVKVADKIIQVEATSVNSKNEKISALAGKPGGDIIKIERDNIHDEPSLKIIAEQELKKRLYDGYEGDITTWLNPYCTYGYNAKIQDANYPQRQGTYYVEAATTTFDRSGGKRKITLGRLVDAAPEENKKSNSENP